MTDLKPVSHTKNQLVEQKKTELQGYVPRASGDYLYVAQLREGSFSMSTLRLFLHYKNN